MASPKEPRTHVTYLRLNLPGDSISIGSVGFGESFGMVRRPGLGEEDAWQLSISGAVLAQFNLDSSSMDLILLRHIILHRCEGCDMQSSWKKKPYFSG